MVRCLSKDLLVDPYLKVVPSDREMRCLAGRRAKGLHEGCACQDFLTTRSLRVEVLLSRVRVRVVSPTMIIGDDPSAL